LRVIVMCSAAGLDESVQQYNPLPDLLSGLRYHRDLPLAASSRAGRGFLCADHRVIAYRSSSMAWSGRPETCPY
jgi:hypothetical protein